MTVLKGKDGDLASYFDKIENETEAGKFDSTLKRILINNLKTEANKQKINDQLPLKVVLRFCKTFKKITKQIGFQYNF